MRRPRIYTELSLQPNSTLALDPRNNHYLLHVLRVKAGHEITLFDGSGFDFRASVIEVTRKKVAVEIAGDPIPIDNESPLHTTLAIAISKGERMDWVVQKATELGVSEIQPLVTQRVDVKLNHDRIEKKSGHWRSTMISACEQCGRSVLPALQNICNIEEWLERSIKNSNRVCLVLKGGGRSFAEIQSGYSDAPKQAVVLIGPEGGLTDPEIAQAQQQGFVATGFGKRVLRTETAPIVALSMLQLAWGDYSS